MLPQRPARPPRIRGWVLLALVVIAGWYVHAKVDVRALWSRLIHYQQSSILEPATLPDAEFHCDGRTQCTQMRSCAEARHFMTYCPNTNLDGNGNGVPCEEKLCR